RWRAQGAAYGLEHARIHAAARAARRHSGWRGWAACLLHPFLSFRDGGARHADRHGQLWPEGDGGGGPRQYVWNTVSPGKEPVAGAEADREFPEVDTVILFPAIDLKDGAAVRLKLGDMNQATVFNTDPAA